MSPRLGHMNPRPRSEPSTSTLTGGSSSAASPDPSSDVVDERDTVLPVSAQPTMSPHLAEVVARARARAEEMGELRPRKVGTFESAFTDEAREILAEWRRGGGYESALATVVADDPQLADQ